MNTAHRSKFWNLPNSITFGRLLIAPFLLVLILFIDNKASHIELNRILSFTSAMIFSAAMALDIVDGYLARRYNLISNFGIFLDPLADKILFLTAMIMMIPLGRIPAWIVAIFFIREVIITALRGIGAEEGIVIDASHWGKYKSALVSAATIGLLLHYPFFGVQWRLIAWIFLIPALLMSIGSGLHYTIEFFRALSRLRPA
jgi:CDP-diacylglycerol--glycerol-3-phosphate 3-phosphatidyltransferase